LCRVWPSTDLSGFTSCCPGKVGFDPTSTLLECDVNIRTVKVDGLLEEIIMIYMKSPKEQKLAGRVTGTFSCPVLAFKKWKNISRVSMTRTGPAFRLPDGSCLTSNLLNIKLKALLGK
jgi:hypothetical protein